MLDLTRQMGLVSTEGLKRTSVTLVGAGSVGSFAGLSLTKLGVEKLEVFDIDGVSEHNIPNQFYRIKDAESSNFKVCALEEILKEFNGVEIKGNKCLYSNQPLNEVVIVCTDSMSSRKVVFEEFCKQPNAAHFIDARMGGELAVLYHISKRMDFDESLVLVEEDEKFYRNSLHSDEDSEEIPCTARTIIYNVLIIAGLISRAVKAFVNEEKCYPREVIFDMKNLIFIPRT